MGRKALEENGDGAAVEEGAVAEGAEGRSPSYQRWKGAWLLGAFNGAVAEGKEECLRFYQSWKGAWLGCCVQ